MSDKSIEAVEKILGAPVSAEFPEQVIKIRRNALVFGLLSITIALGDVRLNPSSTILGFQFVGLNEALINNALVGINIYLLTHFIWYAFDGFLEWRLRITGTKLAFVTAAKFAEEDEDAPDDPRQSTLYTWWSRRAKIIGNFNKRLNDIDNTLRSIETELRKTTPDSNPSCKAALDILNQSLQTFAKLKGTVEATERTFALQRIPTSLKRFDNWYELFCRSQNLRWLLIDVLVPIFVSGYALLLLTAQYF